MIKKERYKRNWEKGWLDVILNQADQAVQRWPEWMRDPGLRYPLNRHSVSKNNQKSDDENKEVGNAR